MKDTSKAEFDELIDAGKILAAHGVAGELKVDPWSDSPDLLCRLKVCYTDGVRYELAHARLVSGYPLIQLHGINSREAALAMRGKVIRVRRRDVPLSENRFFLADAVGMTVTDAQTGDCLGIVREVIQSPAQNLLSVDKDGTAFLIPAGLPFLQEVNVSSGILRVNLIEGLRESCTK